MDRNEVLRKLPKVDEVLSNQRLVPFFGEIPREVAKEAVREGLCRVRKDIEAGKDYDPDALMQEILRYMEVIQRPNFRPVINATGVVHTNLGRAPLPRSACQRVAEAAGAYGNLEYDLANGSRGSRHSLVEDLICRVTGSEAGMAVNNNASATLLVLAAMAGGKETIVSRGELVEIGGSFRIPDIMEISRARLVEVGTTNKTRVKDYEDAITENTGILLKVHTSNYAIIGFTEEADLRDLSKLGRKRGIPVVYDMGSGLLTDLSNQGIREDTVAQALAFGADVVFFSGDKLLGGPQAGIIAGKREYIEAIKKHPLARVVRADKMTLAALESVLGLYLDPEDAKNKVPVLAMICREGETLEKEARRAASMFRKKIRAHRGQQNRNSGEWHFSVIPTQGKVGGGTTPLAVLPGYGIMVQRDNLTAAELDRKLRQGKVPVIGRINKDRYILDFRTILQGQAALVAEALCRVDQEVSPSEPGEGGLK